METNYNWKKTIGPVMLLNFIGRPYQACENRIEVGEFYSSGLLSEIYFEISETVEGMSHSLPHTMLCHDNYYLIVQIYSKKNLKLGLFVKI